MANSKFDAFQSIPRDTTIVNEFCRMYSPVTAPRNNDIVEFNVVSSGRNFIDLSRTRMKVTIEITKTDGTAITKDNKCAPIANSFYSLFKSVEVQLNGTQMNQGESSNSIHKAYIDILMTKDEQYVKTQGMLTGFLKDSAFNVDSVNMSQSDNTGLRKRWFYVKQNGKAELSGFLVNDIFQIDKYLPSGIGLNLKFHLTRPECYLMTGDDSEYTYTISAATLYVNYITPSDTLFVGFHKALDKELALFRCPRSDLSAFVIPANVTTAFVDNILTQGIPQVVYVTLLLNRSYSGVKDKSPFNYQHFSANLITLEFEGRTVGGYSLSPKFNKDYSEGTTINYDHQFADAYMNLFFKHGNKSQGCLISPEEYRGGFFILRWDIPEQLRNQKPAADTPQGLTRISFKFDTALTEPVCVLIYTQYNSVFGIDAQKNVLLYPPVK